MAVATQFTRSTTGSSPPAAAGFLPALNLTRFSDSYFDDDSGLVASPTDNGNGSDIVARSADNSLPSTPVGEGTRNQVPGILDRRKTTRPNTGRSGSGDSVRRGKTGKGFGPNIPIRVSPMASMADVRNGLRMQDGDLTPGESSDAFEDATEGTPSAGSRAGSRAPSGNSSVEKSEDGGPVGLGIHGHAGKVSTMVAGQEQERSISPNGLSIKSSRPVSSEDARGLTLEQELEQERSISSSPIDNDTTPRMPSHSRQVTAETAPTLVANKVMAYEQNRTGSPERSINRSRSRPSEPDLERNVSLSSLRAGLQTHSRQTTAETIQPVMPQPIESEPDRSTSPSKVQSGQQSPVKMVRGFSGEIPLASPPPPSSAGRIQALEQRHIGERPSPSPQQGGLMRTASTRMGAFLGRMGTIRKTGRSPPGPRPDGRYAAERRNTAQSVISTGADGLAPIADAAEGVDGTHARPSLQDQFQTVRKQEEQSTQGANGHLSVGDEEQTLYARTASDAGLASPTSPVKESPEFRSHRASSSPNLLRSPPLDPSLPPGTASGLTAGPAEEPRPVDWDLWQAVVYEGPSAVAKTSGDELNQAIASGIPACIRGVVWQVLAESKNAELENVYRALKAKGTTEEHLAVDNLRPASVSRKASQINVNGAAESGEKESQVSSSRSSIRSEHSTPATSNMVSPPPSVHGEDQETKATVLAEKQKQEAAALTKLERAIKRDLGSRTSYNKFTQAAGLQDGLFGVCKAYALFDEGVGYAQGMNFIAMPLLFNMTEEEAFTLLVRLMSKYDLRSLFIGDLAGLHLRLYQFERLLEDHDPALYCHLRRWNVGPQLYATQWFLTLFAYRFPLQLVTRVYDLVFSEGLTAILKFGLVLMQHNREALLEMKDMGHLTTFLKEKLFDVYIDKTPSASSLLDSGFFGSVTGGADKELYRADEMVRDACEIKVPDSTLAQYTTEWEDSQRQSHQRDVELEALRSANATLVTKVKALEDRTQQQDSEHVAIAGDLVRIKVNNDALLDENEGLNMKVEELQKLVDAQPAEIESTLKEEMDRILQRNSEVQSENRVLKEEQEEMERELVNVKMMHAQTQSDYEALIQKWSNVQAMLSER